jgi:hypothetical protein
MLSKTVGLLVAILGLVATAQAQEKKTVVGSGNVITEARQVSGFHAVEVSGVGTLVLSQGEKESLRVEADDTVLPYLISEVKDGKLHLHIKNNVSLKDTQPIRYLLTVRNIDTLTLTGATAGEVSRLKTDRLQLTLTGAGRCKMEAQEIGKLTVLVTGAGEIALNGKADNLNLTMTGASRYAGSDFAVQDAQVKITGASYAVLHSQNSLSVSATGASKVEYRGKPNVKSHVSGVSKVLAIEN